MSLKTDTSLFIQYTIEVYIVALIYVDDIIITCSSSKAVSNLISQLNAQFALKKI